MWRNRFPKVLTLHENLKPSSPPFAVHAAQGERRGFGGVLQFQNRMDFEAGNNREFPLGAPHPQGKHKSPPLFLWAGTFPAATNHKHSDSEWDLGIKVDFVTFWFCFGFVRDGNADTINHFPRETHLRFEKGNGFSMPFGRIIPSQ